MKVEDFSALDLNIARARVMLSLVALLSIYVDPSAGGLFHLDAYLLATLLCHLAYSLGIYFALSRGIAPRTLHRASTALDISFATAVTVLTERATSPSYIFFVFAIVAVGFRTTLRATLAVTGVCVVSNGNRDASWVDQPVPDENGIPGHRRISDRLFRPTAGEIRGPFA